QKSRGEEIKCNVCFEWVPIENAHTLGCPHTYCSACLVDLFESAAFVDTSLFPPRCCGNPIPLDLGRNLLPKKIIKDFDLKVEELSSTNPTFCSNFDCGKFIREAEIKHNIGVCIFCETRTCEVCKGKEHEQELCPQDQETITLKEEAKRAKWQECSNCKNMVELSEGCFHMTCRCRYQFCYLCGLQWKTCTC
ncbi:hypothetical protein CC80DRAFT_394034, partial [Byssothecium circinans]